MNQIAEFLAQPLPSPKDATTSAWEFRKMLKGQGVTEEQWAQCMRNVLSHVHGSWRPALERQLQHRLTSPLMSEYDKYLGYCFIFEQSLKSKDVVVVVAQRPSADLPTVLVECSGGVVQAIYTSQNVKLDIAVFDHDELSERSDVLPLEHDAYFEQIRAELDSVQSWRTPHNNYPSPEGEDGN